MFYFSKLHFCCFTFENTPSCSFKYFESCDVIVLKKKSLLKVSVLRHTEPYSDISELCVTFTYTSVPFSKP